LSALLLVAFGLGAGASAASAAAPFASGDDAANIPLDASGKWVVQRWVARHTGVLDRLYFYAKVEGSDDCAYGGRSGYAGGTSGRLLATTHRVLPGGAPDMSSTLARSEFVPCGNDDRETVAIDLDFPVTQGQEYATVIRNSDPRPAENFFSANFLYQDSGVVGANGRNERDPAAQDTYYGLDPRELVGYSTDAGRTWRLPGGPYGGSSGRAFIPTYIQQYADGTTGGQPYYWSTAASGDVSMVFPRLPTSWTIDAIGAYTSASSSGTVTVVVDGVERARARLSGRGFLRTAISPVTVAPGQSVTVRTRAGSGGLALRRMQVDQFWVSKLGLGASYRYYSGEDLRTAATVYPLPSYWSPAPGAPPAAGPAPAAPPSVGARAGLLRLTVRPRAATAVLRAPSAGRADVRLLAGGLLVGRCAGVRVKAGARVECRLERGTGRTLGRITARATLRTGTRLVRAARSAGAGTARSTRARNAISVTLLSGQRVVRGRVNRRIPGRLKVALRVGSRRCVAEPGSRSRVARCRLPVRTRVAGVTGVLRAGRGIVRQGLRVRILP
jgi:hypothetical protein